MKTSQTRQQEIRRERVEAAIEGRMAALFGRLPRREMLLTLAVIVDTFVQVSLPSFRSDLPAIAALHPVNFLVLVVMLWTLARWDRLLIQRDTGGASSAPAV